MLYIEHRGKVAILELYGLDEMIGLLLGGTVDAVEMVSAAGKAIFASLIEVVAEVAIGLGSALGGLNHYKAYGTMVYLTVILKLVPIDAALMMGDIDTVDLVALGIAYVAIQCTPTEAERANKEIIEEIEINSDNCSSANPIRPTWHVL